jgi:integrase
MPRKKRKYEEYMTLGTGPDGKRIRKFIAADSKPEFDRLRYEARKQYETVRNPSLITFKAYADKWLEVFKAGASVQTRSMYVYAIKKCAPVYGRQLRQITASDLQGIVNQHADHPRSCQQLKLTLKQIYAAAIKDGIIPPVNLAADLKVPEYKAPERRFISDTEMEKIDGCSFQPLDGLYVDVLRGTGMRPAEALALQWTDIDLSRLQIAVQRAFEFQGNNPRVKPTKTNVSRLVPITQALADRLAAEKRKGIWIFTRDGSPFTKSMFDKLSARILKEIGLNGVTLYSFRHTYATWLYYHAVVPGIITVKKAAQIMGHSEQMYTRIYTHINDRHEDLDALRSALEGDQKETRETKRRPKIGTNPAK